jgi:hypothetical protein
MKTTLIRYALVILTAVMLTTVGQAQIISNGSFELPGSTNSGTVYVVETQGITSWTLSGAGFAGVTIHKTPELGDLLNNQTFNFAQDGNYYLDLSGAGNHATIYQDFATVPSTLYELAFYIGASDDQPTAATINVKLDGTASLLDVILTPDAPTTNISWSRQTVLFTADSSTTRLSFLDVGPSGDNNTSFVDNVTVTVVPEPSVTVLLIGAGILAFARRRFCKA